MERGTGERYSGERNSGERNRREVQWREEQERGTVERGISLNQILSSLVTALEYHLLIHNLQHIRLDQCQVLHST